MSKVRVLQVTGRMRFGGGIESWLMGFFRSYDRELIQMDYCFTGPGPGDPTDAPEGSGDFEDELEALETRIIECRFGYNYLLFPGRFAKVLKQGSYDVVHVHRHDFSGAMIHGAKLADVPIRIAHYHTTQQSHSYDLKRRLFLLPLRWWTRTDATHIFGASRAVLKAAWPNLSEYGDSRLKSFSCGIDIEKFRVDVDKATVRSEFGLPFNVPVLGNIGRFEKVKNHSAFIRIAKKVLRELPNVHFLLVGDGVLRKEVERLAKDEGLADKVVFTGWREDIPSVLKAIDVFLLPSLWEGFGIVIIEAIAAGVPVVVSDVPGTEDATIGPFKDFRFSLDDEDTAVKNVLFLLKNKQAAQKAVEECASELKKFDSKVGFERLQSLYCSEGGFIRK